MQVNVVKHYVRESNEIEFSVPIDIYIELFSSVIVLIISTVFSILPFKSIVSAPELAKMFVFLKLFVSFRSYDNVISKDFKPYRHRGTAVMELKQRAALLETVNK